MNEILFSPDKFFQKKNSISVGDFLENILLLESVFVLAMFS